MAKDPLVASAIAHWAPRFVANGISLTDFEEVTAGIDRWADWCDRRADREARRKVRSVVRLDGKHFRPGKPADDDDAERAEAW